MKMKTSFKNREIIVTCKNYEEVDFDIGTDKYFTQFNGFGGFNYFNYVDSSKHNIKATSFLNIYLDDKLIDIFARKRVYNAGRRQKIIIYLKEGKITINQYGFDSYIFYTFKIDLHQYMKVSIGFDYTSFKDVPQLVCNTDYIYEENNYSYYVNKNCEKLKFNVAISFTHNPNTIIKKANNILRNINNEIKNIYLPKNCDDELTKTLYVSSLFTALQNYKNVGYFRGLSAGVNYVSPFRTYFRDSYWTSLCLYKNYPQIVRDQIITLAKGIKEDGECPSAVLTNYDGFWGKHYDSPCFFIMMVSDYVHQTGEKDILNVKINESHSIKELLEKVILYLMKTTDSTHLIYKNGPFNRLDWADAVNRTGYVTYDECLYYRALICLGYLLGNNSYIKEAEIVKNSINNILWDKDKKYYVNFKNEEYVEDNLSIDTVLTILFDICPNEKINDLLDNLENILYSKNHKELEDFGPMVCFPSYKKIESVVSISGQAYRYHNCSNWPYWSGILGYVLQHNGRDASYALKSWFSYNVKRHYLTPIEFFSPYYKHGSNLQAWSATTAFALQYCDLDFFKI